MTISLWDSFWCNIWWLLAGVLIGLLLCTLLRACCCKKRGCANQSKGCCAQPDSCCAEPPAAQVETTKPSMAVSPSASPALMPAAPVSAALTWDAAAAKALGINTKGPEDLKVVEGIGPKTEALLKAEGIQTWQDLANTPLSRIEDILKTQEWAKLRMPSCVTWAEQAQLAAQGQWTKLKAMQGSLNDGVRVAGGE